MSEPGLIFELGLRRVPLALPTPFTHPLLPIPAEERKGASRISAANRSLQNVSTWRTDACQRGIRRSRSCCFQCPANAGFRVFRGQTTSCISTGFSEASFRQLALTRDHGSRCREEPPCGGLPSSGLAPCHDFVWRRNPSDGNPPGFFAPPDAEARFAGHGKTRKFGSPALSPFRVLPRRPTGRFCATRGAGVRLSSHLRLSVFFRVGRKAASASGRDASRRRIAARRRGPRR